MGYGAENVAPAAFHNRSRALNGILVVGIAILMAVALPPSAVFSSPAGAGSSGSGLTALSSSTPAVAAHKDFNVSAGSGTSPNLAVRTGDTIIAFAAVYGRNSVTISDSSLNTYATLFSATEKDPAGGDSLWIFAAYGAAANSADQVTAKLTGSSTDSASVDVVDVTGVGSHPLDALGSLANYSTAKDPDNSSTDVATSTSDLVLGGVAAHETRDWSARAGDTLLNDEHAPVKNALMTAVDLDADALGAGHVWINATTSRTNTYWMAEGLSLRPAVTNATVTFQESGLSGQKWYADLGGMIGSSTTSQIAFTMPTGTYRFLIGLISGFTTSPESGSITVTGTAVNQSVTFRPDTSDWPTYLGEVTRDAANPNQTTISVGDAANLTPLWNLSTGYIQTEAVVSGGMAYVGGVNGNEYGINAATGAQVWRTYLGQVLQPNCGAHPGGITSSATVAGGVVYVGGGNRSGNITSGTVDWYALNASTGHILWSIPIGRINSGYYNWASPLIADGNAYVGVASRCDRPLVWGGLLQISLSTHQVIGFFNTTQGDLGIRGVSVWGSPTFDAPNNTIYFATGNPLHNHTSNWSESVIAINATTLAPLDSWKVPAAQAIKDSDFGTTPTYLHLPNGTAMVAQTNKNGITYALNATRLSAGPLWQSKVSYTEYPANVAPIAWGSGLLFAGSGPSTINGKNYSGSIRAFYPENGTVKWVLNMPGDVYGAPAYSNGVLVVTGGRALDVFNASTGKLLWNWTCKASFNAGPTIAEGRIYAPCGETYAFGFTGVLGTGAGAFGLPADVSHSGSVVPSAVVPLHSLGVALAVNRRAD